MAESSVPTKTCYKCGADITNSPDWCARCGSTQNTTCRRCGTVYEKALGRCPQCGTIRVRKKRSRRKTSISQKIATFASENKRLLIYAGVGAFLGVAIPRALISLAAVSMPEGWLDTLDYRSLHLRDIGTILTAAGRTMATFAFSVGAGIAGWFAHYKSGLIAAAIGAAIAVMIGILTGRASRKSTTGK